MSESVLERTRTQHRGARGERRSDTLYQEAGASWKLEIGALAGQRMDRIVTLKEAHNSGSTFGSAWHVAAYEAARQALALQIKAGEIRRTRVLAAEWRRLKARVIGWGRLPSDWDGNDGITPSRRVILSALVFLTAAKMQEVPIPKGFVAGDGEVGFRWEKKEFFASAAFLPDGHIVAYSRTSQAAPAITLDVLFDPTVNLDRFLLSLKAFAQ